MKKSAKRSVVRKIRRLERAMEAGKFRRVNSWFPGDEASGIYVAGERDGGVEFAIEISDSVSRDNRRSGVLSWVWLRNDIARVLARRILEVIPTRQSRKGCRLVGGKLV